MSQSEAATSFRSGVGNDSEKIQRWLNSAALAAAGALIGFGIILWIAANWDDLGKAGRFAIVGSAVLVSAMIAATVKSGRIPASFSGVLAIGGLLALIGQTYQSGADPWSLFAFWAAIALPWVIAARHDSVWILWTIVAFAALSLWLNAHGSFLVSQPSLILPAWIIAAAGTSLLGSWTGLDRWIGSTKWAFRLAVVLTLSLIVGSTAPAIVRSGLADVVALAGLFTVALTIVAFIYLKPFDLTLLALTTLALDVLLICAVAYFVFGRGTGSDAATLRMLLVGLLSAGIIAGSAAALLSVARSRGVNLVTGLQQSASVWPVVAMSAIGAVIAAVPILLFFGLALGDILMKGPGPFIVGGLLLAAALGVVRASQPLGFRQHLGIIGLIVGLMLLGFGCYRDLPTDAAHLAMLLAVCGLALAVPAGWIAAILGAAAAIFTTLLISNAVNSSLEASFSQSFEPGKSLVAVFGIAALVIASRMRAPLNAAAESTADVRLNRFFSGWVAAALVGLLIASGRTFLLSASLGLGGGSGIHSAQATMDLSFSFLPILSLVLAAAACSWLLFARPKLRSTTGIAACGVASILAFFMTGLGATLAVFAGAVSINRRVLAILAVMVALWIFGTFYYWLGWPLVHKALLLIALGVGLGAIAWAHRNKTAAGDHASGQRGLGAMATTALIAVSVVATAALAGTGIWQKEHLIGSGRKAFVALAPVDPRSLIQGDYMALRFALPRSQDFPNQKTIAGKTLYAIATVDPREVATVQAVTTTIPALAADEIAMILTRKGGRWILGTDAWFFKEGTAENFEKARFGDFRVGKGGDTILVGLADENLQEIK